MSTFYTATVGTTDYGFDFITQNIEIENLITLVTADDLKVAIREAEASVEGIVFNQIATTGNPVSLDPASGSSTALNVILLENWGILSLSTSGAFTMSGGNVVNVTNGVDIFSSNPLVNTTNNTSQAGTRVTSGGSGLTTADLADILVQVIIGNEINGR